VGENSLKKHLIIDRDVVTRLSSLPPERRFDFWKAVGQLIESFGRPHIHTGLGIRKLRPRLFEFRLGIDLRVLVRDRRAACISPSLALTTRCRTRFGAENTVDFFLQRAHTH
jgi:hypothetical protein